MVSRLSHDRVLNAFKSEGYTLLSQYTNAIRKLEFICPKGHKHSVSWNCFQRGIRCAYCTRPPVDKDLVQRTFESRGYKLLSEYKSNKKLEFICPNGHQHSMLWTHFRKGHECTYCAKHAVKEEDVQQAFEREGYTLLDGFKRSNNKMRFVCPKGHNYSITWDSFRSGSRCAYCSNKKGIAEEVNRCFSAAGYTLTGEYINSSQKINFICPKGHQHSILWSHFKKGVRCAYCAGSIVLHEQVEKAFESRGYKLLSEYKNHKDKLLFECPYGHTYQISWNGFQSGGGCALCLVRCRTDEDKELKEIASRIRCNIKTYLQVFRRKNQFYEVRLRGKTRLAYDLAANIYEKFGALPENNDLDHIIPQSFFDFSNREEIFACWHVENLRYLPSNKNQSRGNRLHLEEVKSFSEKQLEILQSASRKPGKWGLYLKELGINKEFNLTSTVIHT